MNPMFRDIIVVSISFLLGLVDLSVGMGFGFTVTPILILLGFSVTDALPAILASSFLGGVISSLSHQRLGNVDFNIKSREFRMAILMGAIGIIGMYIGVYFSFNLPQKYSQTYIGLITLLSGLFIQLKKSLSFKFTWPRITLMGLIGAANKGLTGGGYGPVITSGGILSGINEKAAIAIQSLSESFVSLIGFYYYYMASKAILWSLTINTALGVIMAAPLAALIIKNFNEEDIKNVITFTSIIMSALIIMKTWNLFIFK